MNPTQTKACTKCKLKKPLTDYAIDKRRSDGHVSKCKSCYRKYDTEYYDANAELLVDKELARREGQPKQVKGETITSMSVTVKFGPKDMRSIKAAFIKEYGREPVGDQLAEWVISIAKGGVIGRAQYILEREAKKAGL